MADSTREELRRIVTRSGETGRIPELLEDELDKLEEFVQSEITKAIEAKNKIDNGDFHTLLFKYGEVCEKEGLLSKDAVTIRMDIATHLNYINSLADNTIEEITKAQEQLLDELLGHGERGGHDVYCRTIGEAVIAKRKALKEGK